MIALAEVGLAILSKGAKGASIDVKGLAATSPFGSYIQKSIIPLIGKWK